MGGGMTPLPDGALYVGCVVHKRARPKRHCLRYRVFSLRVDLDRLHELDQRLRLFSLNRFNLFSIVERDFGARDASSIAAFVRARARSMGISSVSRVEMLCYPRVLGFAFNPITVYYVFDSDDVLRGLVYDVRNTFGEHHFYEARFDGETVGTVGHSLPKAFYVSPFNGVDGIYRFAIRPPGERVFTGVMLSDSEGPVVTAYFEGKGEALTDGALLRLAVTYPLMTLKVIVGIHWEALRLWMKGVPLTLAARRRIHVKRI